MYPARTYMVFDIETIIDPHLPLPKTGDQNALPPPPYHQVVAIGALLLDQAFRPIKLDIIGRHEPEVRVLEKFVLSVEKRRPVLVTFNGRGFDLPVIVARCLRHGIPFPHYYKSRDVRYRFSADGHLDLMDYLADYGAARAVSLDTYAKLIGLPGKVGVDGKDVGPLVHAGRLDEVYDYCLCDVVQTTGLFLRVQLLRGEMNREQYREAMQVFIDFMASKQSVAPVYRAIDKAALLLMEDSSPDRDVGDSSDGVPAEQEPSETERT